ncbi:hypothetical protein EGR_11052 [Echinococcus granulosus]|uniref:Uncharacterized protein n=1 Tax=Echinococcus granulosus TaxID=6210 RepID=W6UKR8_ECHGR|nr:hypothetical protein EGR_11052 [Echinococcus granulosus]EUB54089.1 hypothetical protein EGR_11052 [Echinococcus granulosus]
MYAHMMVCVGALCINIIVAVDDFYMWLYFVLSIRCLHILQCVDLYRFIELVCIPMLSLFYITNVFAQLLACVKFGRIFVLLKMCWHGRVYRYIIKLMILPKMFFKYILDNQCSVICSIFVSLHFAQVCLS